MKKASVCEANKNQTVAAFHTKKVLYEVKNQLAQYNEQPVSYFHLFNASRRSSGAGRGGLVG